MWSLWLPVVLVSLAASLHAARIPLLPPGTPIVSLSAAPPPVTGKHLDLEPSDKQVEELESLANQAKRAEAKAESSGREAKLFEKDKVIHRTLDRGASELAWKNWLQSPESKDPAAPPRRITPKSVFVAPLNCPEGKRLTEEGCISIHTVGKEAHEQYILEQLNSMSDPGGVVYDYDDGPLGVGVDPAEGPLQLNLPLGPTFVAASSQNVPSRLPLSADKKDDKKTEAAELEAELEKLKKEIEIIASINKLHRPLTHVIIDAYPKPAADKPKRDNDKANFTADQILQDEGQKEIVFGGVSEDKYPLDATHEAVRLPDPTEPTTEPETATDSEATTEPTSTPPSTRPETTETTADEAGTSTTTERNLKEDEKPTELHPEIDYSDIGEAIKLISRYADVTTDESFGDRRPERAEDGPLGTRTKLQHRKKPPPPAYTYADRVPARLVYPRPPAYYRFPAPPPDFPFRHVQEYWSRGAELAGPYAHNPRRHRHSQQPLRRARRPPAPPPPPLYRLLGLQHWLDGDAAAER